MYSSNGLKANYSWITLVSTNAYLWTTWKVMMTQAVQPTCALKIYLTRFFPNIS